DRTRKGGCSQSSESKRGRQSESLVEVQYSCDSGAAFLQKRSTTRSSHRSYQQEGSAQPVGSIGVDKFSAARNLIETPRCSVRPAHGADPPKEYAPGGARTHNLWLRRPTLYPVELRAQRERQLATNRAGFHRFSDVVLLTLMFRARGQMISAFRLQNRSLRMRVCARSRAAGDEFMNQVIDTIEKEQQKSEAKPFSVGDSVRVHTRVVEGDK